MTPAAGPSPNASNLGESVRLPLIPKLLIFRKEGFLVRRHTPCQRKLAGASQVFKGGADSRRFEIYLVNFPRGVSNDLRHGQ